MAEQKDFVAKVVGAASQGAVGAFVAACLSAVTEPIVNKVLVKRIPLSQAIAEMDPKGIVDFLRTALATNFIKFPFFEATNVIMSTIDVPGGPTIRGAVTGSVFCTTTLPITNYRFCKSMKQEVDAKSLYKAYLPTVCRDILYGIFRNKVSSALLAARGPAVSATNWGRFSNMYMTVMAACILSAPANEFRGYSLQNPAHFQPFAKFFQPSKFIRSTSVGALIMSFSLAFGTLATPQVEKLWGTIRDYLSKNPLGYLLIVLFVLNQVLADRRAASLEDQKSKSK